MAPAYSCCRNNFLSHSQHLLKKGRTGNKVIWQAPSQNGKENQKLQLGRGDWRGHRTQEEAVQLSVHRPSFSPGPQKEKKRGEREAGPHGAAAATMEALKLQWAGDGRKSREGGAFRRASHEKIQHLSSCEDKLWGKEPPDL